jgi:hypothetical protein
MRLRHLAFTAVVGLVASTALAGCGSSGGGNTESGSAVIGHNTDAPDTGQAGTGRAGDIVVPKGSYVLGKNSVSLRLDISNTGATPDRLVQATSNVSAAGTLTPNPMPIPARSTVHVGAGSTSITLPVTGSLDPGATLAVTLLFAKNGQLLVYALTPS